MIDWLLRVARLLQYLGCDTLHLLSASLWIGALAVLTRQASSGSAEHADGRRVLGERLAHFSRVGPVAVTVLAATGIVNAVFLLGSNPWRSLLFDPYGRLLAVKVALFLLMLPLAGLNRLRLTPALQLEMPRAAATSCPARTLCLLRWSLAAESLLAALVLVAVAILGTLAPPVSR